MSPVEKPRWRLKVTTALNYWTAAVFIAAVLRLFFLHGLDLRVFGLFLIPPVVALLMERVSIRLSTRVLAASFLTLVNIGVALAPVDRLFPNLGGVHPGLSPENDRILTWYCVVYLMYFFLVMPLVFFTRGLADHFAGRKADLSVFTCALGLGACLFVGPLMFTVTEDILGLSPVWSSQSILQEQPSDTGNGAIPRPVESSSTESGMNVDEGAT